MDERLPSDVEERVLGIAFLDLARFSVWASERSDFEVAGMLQSFYALVAHQLGRAGGRIVKVIGDAALAVFEPERTADVVSALRQLAGEIEGGALAADFETRLDVKVHVGTVIAGSFGPPGLERFDVLGRAVNETALLGGKGLVLSAEATMRLP